MEGMWVARCKNGDLLLFIGLEEPRKNDDVWHANWLMTRAVMIDRRLFPDVRWSDEKPTKVKLVIE